MCKALSGSAPFSHADIEAFVARVHAEGLARYRDLVWRRVRDGYAVLVSEVMLQQTQAPRVERYWPRWLESFPTLEALSAAPLPPVLEAWQGLGYNRRAIALKRLAEMVVAQASERGLATAELPREEAALLALPGVGPATAAGVRAFAFGEVVAYLETNVRSVFLHELFHDRDGVSDSELLPVVWRAAETAATLGIDPRSWNWALLDYGAHLKRTLPNPSRRSAHHARQSRFEGSHRQKRARLLKLAMSSQQLTAEDAAAELSAIEIASGRGPVTVADAGGLLKELAADGFLVCEAGVWRVA